MVGLPASVLLYASTSQNVILHTSLNNPCLHVAEMISRGFRQLEECSHFAAVMFLDREHFGLFDGDVVHNHASTASLALVTHVCMYVQLNRMPEICK